MKQLKLEPTIFSWNLAYGGTLRRKRKGRGPRPLSKKEPLHLVLKSNFMGTHLSFRNYRYFDKLETLLKFTAKKYGVRIEQRAWAGDHAHFLIRIHSRELYKAFIRVLTSRIVAVVTEGRMRLRTGDKVWKYRPFSRVVRGYRAYKTVRAYVRLNEMESRGFIPYRKTRLKGLEPPELELVWT